MTTYKDELIKAMTMLAKNKKTVFLGQGVRYSGHGLYPTLKNVDDNKRIELPVCEELQMGMTQGLALEGFIPVSIFPRMDFLICATNQLVNHLDKMEEMSEGEFKPRVIIRTAIGSTNPLMAGCQHIQDHSKALRLMLTNIEVIVLYNKSQIMPAYKKALKIKKSTVLIEIPDRYST